MRSTPKPSIDEKVAKLPVWAQNYISGLRAGAARLQKEADEARQAARENRLPGVQGETNTVMDPYDLQPVYLPDQNVRFILGDRNRRDWIDVRRDRTGLGVEIMASSGLIIKHHASNTCSMSVADVYRFDRAKKVSDWL